MGEVASFSKVFLALLSRLLSRYWILLFKESGKFEDIDNYDSPYEFHSKMNAAANDDTFKPESDQSLQTPSDEGSDLPF